MNNISENREKTDLDTPILFFKSELKKFVNARNWGKYHTPKNLIQALQIEAAELSELFLFKEFKIDEILKDENLLEDISDEVADVFIYLISFINILGGKSKIFQHSKLKLLFLRNSKYAALICPKF